MLNTVMILTSIVVGATTGGAAATFILNKIGR